MTGFQEAMATQAYEQAAAHIHRYMAFDENLVEMALAESEEANGNKDFFKEKERGSLFPKLDMQKNKQKTKNKKQKIKNKK